MTWIKKSRGTNIALVSDHLQLETDFELRGDQPRAIEQICEALVRGDRAQVLLGVTGSGKTFTMAQVLARVNRPALVMVHNKTLAAQLYQEFRRFFPENAVEYFVSYYDYYQPEAYMPASATYIEKEAIINDEIDRLRLLGHAVALPNGATFIIVASVSCIYWPPGSPEALFTGLVGAARPKADAWIATTILTAARRNPGDIPRRNEPRRPVRWRLSCAAAISSSCIPSSRETWACASAWFGDEVDELTTFDPLTGREIRRHDRLTIYPKSHFVAPRARTLSAIDSIKVELQERLAQLESLGKNLEAERLHQRTMFDLEMVKEIGYCHGIENYSRHLSGRAPGEPPPTLLDYLPEDAIIIVDESHQSVPQVRGMYAGDRARKEVLVEYGFRLPSALDNRPLSFAEWEERVGQVVYVSATPGPYELKQSGGVIVEQIIRPYRAGRSADRNSAREGPGRRSAG